MSDLYKLVFRGELLDGQHPAVVRKRLAEAAAFDQAALDKLFSGHPVVLKREADTATAARLQGLFKKAGARLRVLPVDTDGDTASVTRKAQDPAPRSGVDARFELLPAGSDILRSDERRTFEPREVDTDGLSLERAGFVVPDELPAATPAPNVSHLTVAAAGERLAPHRAPLAQPVQAPDLQMAEPGADLAPRAAPAPPLVDFARLEFEVAPAGSHLGQRTPSPPPEPPDTSHLQLSSDV